MTIGEAEDVDVTIHTNILIVGQRTLVCHKDSVGIGRSQFKIGACHTRSIVNSTVFISESCCK